MSSVRLTPGVGESQPANPAQGAPLRLLVFDVNETLSDMSAISARLESLGAPGHLAQTWFAGLLRDGFALTCTQQNPGFADLASDSLRRVLRGAVDDVDGAAHQVLAEFMALPLHGDVVDGIRALGRLGLRLVTLSNGSVSVARGLFERNGIVDAFERLLSVEDAGRWKPAAAAYVYALEQTGCAPREAMLVAVHPWDIHGARRAGLNAAWVNRSGGAYPAYFDAPDMVATSLVDLASQLGSEAP